MGIVYNMLFGGAQKPINRDPKKTLDILCQQSEHRFKRCSFLQPLFFLLRIKRCKTTNKEEKTMTELRERDLIEVAGGKDITIKPNPDGEIWWSWNPSAILDDHGLIY